MQEKFFCSIVIPTIGRSTLDRAVMSVLEQEFCHADFEVIVVNDSSESLPEAEWHNSNRVQIIHTNKRERSFARNSGAAIARGDYLAFLDDDDWLLPGAIESFWQLSCKEPAAAWLYGGIRIIDHLGNCLAEINSGLNGNCFAQIMGGAWAPIQASLIQTQTFFQVGGFSSAVCGTEDEDLCRRIAYCGNFANTSATIACLFRGQSWKTSTNYRRAPEDTKFSRDRVLSEPDAFIRLLASVNSSYWFGRVCRIYMSTMSWNLRKRKLLTGLSRGIWGMVGFILAGKQLITREFWKGMKADHVPDTLHFVVQAYEHKSKSNIHGYNNP